MHTHKVRERKELYDEHRVQSEGVSALSGDTIAGSIVGPKSFIEDAQYCLAIQIRDLIRRMMCVDPIQRITTVQIKEHPFFTNHLPQYLIEECQVRCAC